jgi:hypothetical protein
MARRASASPAPLPPTARSPALRPFLVPSAIQGTSLSVLHQQTLGGASASAAASALASARQQQQQQQQGGSGTGEGLAPAPAPAPVVAPVVSFDQARGGFTLASSDPATLRAALELRRHHAQLQQQRLLEQQQTSPSSAVSGTVTGSGSGSGAAAGWQPHGFPWRGAGTGAPPAGSLLHASFAPLPEQALKRVVLPSTEDLSYTHTRSLAGALRLLESRGGRFSRTSAMRRCFFVLAGACLYWFEAEEDATPQGYIAHRRALGCVAVAGAEVAPAADASLGSGNSLNLGCAFTVTPHAHGRKATALQLEAETLTARDSWLRLLRQAAGTYTPLPVASPVPAPAPAPLPLSALAPMPVLPDYPVYATGPGSGFGGSGFGSVGMPLAPAPVLTEGVGLPPRSPGCSSSGGGNGGSGGAGGGGERVKFAASQHRTSSYLSAPSPGAAGAATGSYGAGAGAGGGSWAAATAAADAAAVTAGGGRGQSASALPHPDAAAAAAAATAAAAAAGLLPPLRSQQHYLTLSAAAAAGAAAELSAAAQAAQQRALSGPGGARAGAGGGEARHESFRDKIVRHLSSGRSGDVPGAGAGLSAGAAAADSQPVDALSELEGWVLRRGRSGAWRRKYAIVGEGAQAGEPYRLRYFDARPEPAGLRPGLAPLPLRTREQGVLSLAGVSVDLAAPAEPGVHPLTVTLLDRRTVLQLALPSAALAAQWAGALRRLSLEISLCGAPGLPPGMAQARAAIAHGGYLDYLKGETWLRAFFVVGTAGGFAVFPSHAHVGGAALAEVSLAGTQVTIVPAEDYDRRFVFRIAFVQGIQFLCCADDEGAYADWLRVLGF